MGEVIVITSGKGGVGKSTLAANLGVALALNGRATALIDMDMGLRSLDIMLGLENRVVYDLADVAEGVCRVKQALVKHPDVPKLCLLNAAQTRGSDALTPVKTEKVIDQLRDRFDYLLIDCPAGIGRGFRNASSCADRAILVTTPDAVALRDGERVIGLLERMDVKPPELAINRVTHDRMDFARACPEKLNLKLLGLIPEDDRAPERASSGRPAVLGKSEAGAAFLRAARRLTGENIPIEEIKRPGLIKRLIRAL